MNGADQVPAGPAAGGMPRAAVTVVEYVTVDDVHRRRPGDEPGYMPEVGDVIRYALRHSAWDAEQCRIPTADDPATWGRGPWSGNKRVVRVNSDGDGYVRYVCRPVGDRNRGHITSIDLDWWVCEHVTGDGALW